MSDPQHPSHQRQEIHVSYRGRDNPRQAREAAFGALYEALTDRPAAEFTGHQTVEVPDGIDWQDPDQLAALSAAARPRRLVRLTYPVVGCACVRAGIPGEHLYTDRCPPPVPELVETSDDDGATWHPVG
jgi:hypothetical protein